MIAKNLLCQEILPLFDTDLISEARNKMVQYEINRLPVVRETDNAFVGLVSEIMLMDENLNDEIIGRLDLEKEINTIGENEHLFDIVKKMSEQSTSILPVVDDKSKYIGLVKHSDVIDSFVKFNAFSDPGGILVLEINSIDYSLLAITQIVESEGTRVLASYVSLQKDTKKMSVTLKLNIIELAPLIATFERYDYAVVASYQEKGNDAFLQDRYESLLHYLNV